MISSNDLRPGVTIEFKHAVWQVIEAMHVKPGKGSAFVQTRLRNMESGGVLKVNFRAGERLQAANVETIELVFAYKDDGEYVMVSAGGSESLSLESVNFGQNADLLVEGQQDIRVSLHRGKVLRVDLPNTVDLDVRETPPDERGDTNFGGTKQAVLETGAVVAVPFHIRTGDKVRIDTRTRQYVARVKE